MHSPSPPLPPWGSFALEILLDLDNWPATWATCFFFLLPALNSSSYVLNVPIKSEPMKPSGSTLSPNKGRTPGPCSLSLSLPAAPLCVLGCAWYAPGLVSNTLFKVSRWLLLTASCNHNNNHKGLASGNVGLEKGDVCGKHTRAQVSGSRHFQPTALPLIGWDLHKTLLLCFLVISAPFYSLNLSVQCWG